MSGSFFPQPAVSDPPVSTPLLVIFDRRGPDLDVLHPGLVPGAIAYTLSAQDDALLTITQLLTETDATRLAIVAHGQPGVVHLAVSSVVSSRNRHPKCLRVFGY